jgi:ABC-type transport system substrate-binding protein
VKLHATNSGQASGRLRNRLVKRAALIAASATVLAACSSPGNKKPACENAFIPVCFQPSWLAANVNATGTPMYGGTLQIEGMNEDDTPPDFDPQLGGGGAAGVAIARQLVSYPASTNLVAADSIVPDAATALPTVSADGLTYSFHIKSGVMWNTTPVRQVTSQDFKRGIERNCDPTLAQDGSDDFYYRATIAGFASFCTTFEGMATSSSPAARVAYINGHDVSGIQTPDSSTIVFTLIRPTVDFPNMLALPFASAAPVEDLSYVPATLSNPLYSDGPYEVEVSKYDPDQAEIDFGRNPAWSQLTDSIRHDYVQYIEIKDDKVGPTVADVVQNDLEIGAADLEWNTNVPAEKVGVLTSQRDARYGAFPAPGQTRPFVRFNVWSPNNNGALGNVKVRQALEYAINKVAIGELFGGSLLTQPLNQVIAPGAEGYVPFNDYPTPNNEGDPGKCKSLLSAAGYPNGLTLKYMYISYEPTPTEVFGDVESDLVKCGITIVAKPLSAGFYGPEGVGGSDDELKSGAWDLTGTGWAPDWYGPANGRAILPDLFDGALGAPAAASAADIGGFDDPAVDTLVTQAEQATTLKAAASLWHQADEQVMRDAAFIPFQTQLIPLFRSARVHNAIYLPFSESYDITQVWLS